MTAAPPAQSVPPDRIDPHTLLILRKYPSLPLTARLLLFIVKDNALRRTFPRFVGQRLRPARPARPGRGLVPSRGGPTHVQSGSGHHVDRGRGRGPGLGLGLRRLLRLPGLLRLLRRLLGLLRRVGLLWRRLLGRLLRLLRRWLGQLLRLPRLLRLLRLLRVLRLLRRRRGRPDGSGGGPGRPGRDAAGAGPGEP